MARRCTLKKVALSSVVALTLHYIAVLEEVCAVSLFLVVVCASTAGLYGMAVCAQLLYNSLTGGTNIIHIKE